MREIYSPSYVQELLGIDSSTLRKYATLLEGHGYPIHRNTKGHRGYFDHDVNTLRKLIKFNKHDGMPLERAALSVMTSVSEKISTGTVMEIGPLQNTNGQDSKQDGITMERAALTVMTSVSEKISTGTVTKIRPLQTTNDQDSKQDCNHDELLERIEHLEQINLDLINLLKEKAIREASQEEKINRIIKYVERTEQLALERNKIEEETRKQIAAASQKKWWRWWK